MSGYTPAMPHPVPDQGPSRTGYSRLHRDHHDTLQGGTTHTSYGVGHRGMYPQALQSSSLQSGTPAYDMAPHASQPPPIPPRPRTEPVQIYSVQSIDYPLGFVRQQSPRQMDLAWSSSQHSAGAWDLLAGLHSHQSTSESHSPYNPGGSRAVCPQNPRSFAAVPLSQAHAGVQNPWVPVPQVHLDFTFLPRPLHEYNWTTMPAKKRKALVIGTNHPLPSDPRYRLKYCTRDAHRVADFLQDELDFARHDIRIITDDNPDDLPTKENILEAMKSLVRGAEPGDSFFFYFSGHGTQIKDTDGDEADGLDECICAMDYRGDDPHQDCNTPGLIVDDTMHELMVKHLPSECRLTAIFDCCHSGTILDLPVIYNSKGAAKPFMHRDGPWIWSQKISSADVVSLSASKDNQEAAESREGGALQRAFIDSVSKFGNTLTYKGLIRNMRDYMRRHGFEQKPQLSASHKINTDLRFVV